MALIFSHHASVQPIARGRLERVLVIVDGIDVILEELALAAIIEEEMITTIIGDEDVAVTLELEEIVAILEEQTIECD